MKLIPKETKKSKIVVNINLRNYNYLSKVFMVSAAEEFKLNLPKAHYRPLRMGQTLTESRLDKILRAA